MANVNFSALYDHILPYLPGAELPVIDLHIRRVLREFYRRTTLWRETFEFATTTDRTYLLTPTSGNVHSVLSVSVDGQRIDPLPESRQPTPAQIAAMDPGVPCAWYSNYANMLSLDPTPTAGIPISAVGVITIPLDLATTQFPEETYNDFCEPIAAGVIGEMMNMPGKPWTQEKSAGRFSGTFVRTVIATRAKLRDGGQPNVSTLRGPRFGR